MGFSSSCQHSHRQHLDDLFRSVPHLLLSTAVIGWKHVKKGCTRGKIPPLLTEGYIYSLLPLDLAQALPGKMLGGRGWDNVRELLAAKQAGLQTPF